MEHAKDLDHLSTVIEREDLVLAYVSTPQCNVCKSLLPKVDQVLDEAGVPGLYVDAEAHPAVAGRHGVFTVPTLILFAQGRESGRWSRYVSVGDVAQSIQRIQAFMR